MTLNLFRTIVFTGLLFPLCSSADSLLVMSLDELRDRIRGGWVGQMIGVSFGFPTEFAYREKIVPANKLPQWQPEMIREALKQDDLYVDITFAQVLDEKGLDASTEDFGAFFREARYPLWHANLSARRALRRGVPATSSGSLEYNLHANDIDFQIEADFIGLMSPAMPQASNEIALRAGQVINQGDGIYGGMFVSAMYASAFFENDVVEVVEAGLGVLPVHSRYGQMIQDVITWWREDPENWESTWNNIHQKWNHGEMCPEGALQPFNIDASLNGAFIALGLLYGGGDFDRTMRITTRAGQDSDCNPASALGILGVMHGFSNIPKRFTSEVESIANDKFLYTDYSLNEIVESSYRRAITLAKRHDGYVSGGKIYINKQTPLAPMGLSSVKSYRVEEEIQFNDTRWNWQGNWRHERVKIWRYHHESMVSDIAGDEAQISFRGSGVALKGILLADGGLLDIYLDGEFIRTVDVYPDEDWAKPQEALWHKLDLENKLHELRVVVRGEPYIESSGSKISISSLLVYNSQLKEETGNKQ